MNNDRTEHTTLIFLHIPKTAGTTFARILRRYYSRNQMRHFSDAAERQEFLTLPDSEKRRYRVLHGHMEFGIHEHLSQPFTYLTFLRDPLERAISLYYFVREQPENRNYEKVQQLPLDEFVANEFRAQHLDDRQTRLLSGVHTDGPCTPDMLEQAKHNLAAHFSMIGLTERFDEAVIMARRQFNWPRPFYYKRLVSNRPQVEQLPESVLAVLRDYNQFDLQLYEYACQLFDERVRRQPPSFPREVATFQRINTLYGIPFYLALALRRRLR